MIAKDEPNIRRTFVAYYVLFILYYSYAICYMLYVILVVFLLYDIWHVTYIDDRLYVACCISFVTFLNCMFYVSSFLHVYHRLHPKP